jgi:hypothetical protein
MSIPGPRDGWIPSSRVDPSLADGCFSSRAENACCYSVYRLMRTEILLEMGVVDSGYARF